MRNKIVVIGMIGLALAVMACGGGAPPTSTPPTAAVADTVAAPTEQPAQATSTEAVPTEQPAATQPAATQASNSSASGGQGVPIGNIQDVLNKACDALNAQENLNINTSITGDQTGQVLYQIAGKDKAHLVLTQDNSTHESFILPTGMYTNNSGKWKKDAVPSAAFAENFIKTTRQATGLFICFNKQGSDQALMEGEITGLAANVALPEVVNGVPCLVYNVNVSVKTADTSGTGQGTYWLGASDSLPYKVNITYSGTKSDGTKTSGQLSSTYSYQAVDIEPPIP